MRETREILLEHAVRYPLMQPCDLVKLLYQQQFGCGHLVTDPDNSLQRLREEAAHTDKADGAPLFESIGNHYARLHLGAAQDCGLSLHSVNRIFLASSLWAEHTDRTSFSSKLCFALEQAQNGVIPFDVPSLEAYLKSYQKAGFPMVSHSEPYRQAYRPAYRVVDARYERLLPLFPVIDSLLAQKGRAVLAIEGNAASGKSTAARLLSLLYPSSVVHMDDFFLPFDLRTPARLEEPGGNVHYERFLTEAAPALQAGIPFSYRPFNCSDGSFKAARSVPAQPLTIVEGAYSTHPSFPPIYDLRVFLSASHEEQEQRILRRNGPEMLQAFLQRWIPMENRYFQTCKIREGCDFVL